MTKFGMAPMQAIKSATTVAADLLDMSGKLGEISRARSRTSWP